MIDENKDKQDILSDNEYQLSDKEIEEYKSGKILYEEVLTLLLKQANNAYIKNEFETFCFTIQSIWNNCYDVDRKYITKEVKRIEVLDTERNYSIRGYHSSKPVLLRLWMFQKMMEYNIGEPNKLSTRQGILCQWRHGSEWRRAYQIMQEVLRKKYQGNVKKYEKDRLLETDR